MDVMKQNASNKFCSSGGLAVYMQWKTFVWRDLTNEYRASVLPTSYLSMYGTWIVQRNDLANAFSSQSTMNTIHFKIFSQISGAMRS